MVSSRRHIPRMKKNRFVLWISGNCAPLRLSPLWSFHLRLELVYKPRSYLEQGVGEYAIQVNWNGCEPDMCNAVCLEEARSWKPRH